MREPDFIKTQSSFWDSLQVVLPKISKKKASPQTALDFPQNYRRLCQDLNLARERGYGTALAEGLQALVWQSHQQLYKPSFHWLKKIKQFFLKDFPQEVRAQWRWVMAATLLFVLPGLAFFLFNFFEPGLVYSVLSDRMVSEMEFMYQDQSYNTKEFLRSATTDFSMFAYYIYNNVSIGFRCFASGLIVGVGPVFFLIYNGLTLGAVASHLSLKGFSNNFFSFVIAHGALELTAIVLAGAAGLKIGISFLAPGPYTRKQALKLAASKAFKIILGASVMLIGAAAIEAFWSPLRLPSNWIWIKYAVGSLLWLLMFTYFLRAGKEHVRQV